MAERIDIKQLGDRMVRVQVFGALDGESMGMLMDAIESYVMGEPYCLFEAVITHMAMISADGRRIAVDRLLQMPQISLAVVGGNFAQKVSAKLVMTAVTVLGPRERIRSAFFDDEDEARRWLREQEALRQADLAAD